MCLQHCIGMKKAQLMNKNNKLWQNIEKCVAVDVVVVVVAFVNATGVA